MAYNLKTFEEILKNQKTWHNGHGIDSLSGRNSSWKFNKIEQKLLIHPHDIIPHWKRFAIKFSRYPTPTPPCLIVQGRGKGGYFKVPLWFSPF